MITRLSSFQKLLKSTIHQSRSHSQFLKVSITLFYLEFVWGGYDLSYFELKPVWRCIILEFPSLPSQLGISGSASSIVFTAMVFSVIHYSKSQVVLLVCARVCFPGRVIQCEIADNLYWENHPQVFLACAVPSSLPEATLQAAYKMREEVAQKLISFGMDNCFFNIEVFGMKDGSVKVKHAIFEVISKHTRVCDVIQTDEGGN